MTLRLLPAFLAATLWSVVAQAQFSKTVHNSFEVDSADVLTLDLRGDVVVEEWAGNTVLVETSVRLYNATKGVFTHFVEKEGRYDVDGELSGATFRVFNTVTDRRAIQTKAGLATEEVTVRVMIPRRFRGEGLGPFTREPDGSGR